MISQFFQILYGKGSIFIDRDPRIFALVLNYLRSGNIHWFDQFENKRVLADELEYFGITINDKKDTSFTQFKQISFDKLFCYGVKIVNAHTIECTQSSDWLSSNYWQIPTYPAASTRDCFAASTEEFSWGIHKFLFQVESRFKCLRIGLITKNRPLVNDPQGFPTFCLQANPDRNFVQLCGSRYAGPYDYAEYKVKESDFIVMAADLEEGTISFEINSNPQFDFFFPPSSNRAFQRTFCSYVYLSVNWFLKNIFSPL